MAGRPKQGINFAGWDVDIFENDTKIDKLIDAQGWVGFAIYFFLCQKAYASDGYFYRWSYDDAATTARKMGGGIRSETVHTTVASCLQFGLFDKRLAEENGVLTSKGIQRRFLAATDRRRNRMVDQNIWLLDKTESEGVDFIPANDDLRNKNSDLRNNNGYLRNANAPKSKGKESKGEESKGKESKAKAAKPPRVYYPNDETLNKAFEDFVAMRNKIKKPMTDRAIDLATRKLEKLATGSDGTMDNDLAVKIIEQSILKDWQDLYPLKDEPKQTRTSTGPIDWENV